MAKGLGQIHTVNYSLQGSSVGDRWLIDCPGQLTNQLNHMVRMCSTFKLVGIDMVCADQDSGDGGQSVTGSIRYYAPTRGRVKALREAYKAVRTAMKVKGINPNNNINYDFRTPLEPLVVYNNGTDFKNAASIQFDYTTNAFVELAIDRNVGRQTVFDIWNAQIEPRQGQVGVPDFSTGYDVTLGGVTGGYTTPTTPITPDYVINEGAYLQSKGQDYASTEYEEIPFTVANSDGTSAALQFQWRPDPALYVSVLMGQFDITIEDFNDENLGQFYDLQCGFHIAGWKNVMSDHKKKRRSKKGKSHGRKRSSKK